jgi:hypothetical protein
MLTFFRSSGVQKNRGMAILFAVLTAAILSAIAVSAFNIAMNELKLSTTAEESTIAFYAADSAVECIMFWDVTQNAFAKSVGDLPELQITCNKLTRAVNRSAPPFTIPVWSTELTDTVSAPKIYGSPVSDPAAQIRFDFPTMNNACAFIILSKWHVEPSPPITINSAIRTNLQAYGRNSCDTSNARRLERGIELNY